MTTPEVSVIIVARNEAAFIVDCLESVCMQFNPDDRWELILVDGNSEDDTVKRARSFMSGKTVAFRVFMNPDLILATGWNLGIRHAAGEFVIRPDAHATLGAGYIKRALELLREMEDVAAVGGMLHTRSKTAMGSVIRVALSMKTGVGNSSFRTGSSAGYKDTVVYGLYRKSVFEKVGLFNERLIRHQDTDMHERIRRSGMRLYMEPAITADYYCRDSVGKLAKQMVGIGFGFSYLVEEGNMRALGWRHLMPFLFYGLLVLLLIAGVFVAEAWMVALFIYIGYLCIIFAEALGKWMATGKVAVMMVTGIIPMMHMAYAWGTAGGLVRLLMKNRKRRK